MLRIEAIPVGGGQAFVIADGTGQRGPGGKMHVDDCEITFDASIQEVAYLGGAATRRFDRQNQSGSWPLDVHYTFETEAECFLWFTSLQTRVPIIADIVITVPGGSRTIPEVALRPLRVRSVGIVAVVVSYPIRFGLVANPAS